MDKKADYCLTKYFTYDTMVDLQQINYPDSLRVIGAEAFSDCVSLETGPDNTKAKIGEKAFFNTLWEKRIRARKDEEARQAEKARQAQAALEAEKARKEKEAKEIEALKNCASECDQQIIALSKHRKERLIRD